MTRYGEGDLFAVPLRDGGYGVGLAANPKLGHAEALWGMPTGADTVRLDNIVTDDGDVLRFGGVARRGGHSTADDVARYHARGWGFWLYGGEVASVNVERPEFFDGPPYLTSRMTV
jgi:hypothetical protein